MKPRFLAVVVIGLFAALIWLLLAGCSKPPAIQYPPLPTMTRAEPTSPPVHPAKPRQAVIRVPSPTPAAHGWIEIQADRWKRARVRPEKEHFAQAIAAQITRNRARYQAVADETGVPWRVIGAIHVLECDGNFRQHLHNGDPITGKTRHVPANRPPGTPPWTWEFSAVDALRFDSLDRKDWTSIGATLQNTELFNGPYYERHGLISPYNHSWDTLYIRGKIVADGRYSATAVSAQCGVVPILKALQ